MTSAASLTSIGATTPTPEPPDSLAVSALVGDALDEFDESDEQAVNKMPTATTEVARTRVRFTRRMA